MTAGHIARYVERGVRRYTLVEAVKPAPTHAGWTTFASRRAARAVAVAPRSGRLWLATWGGVLSWQRGEATYQRFGGEHGLAGAVACVALDAEERPWVGHDEGGLAWFDGRRWHVGAELRPEPIRAVAPARDGGVWAAGPETVYHVPGPGRPPSPLARGHDGATAVRALLAHDDGVLSATPRGLFLLRAGREPIVVEPDLLPCCTALARDAVGAVWAASPGAVLRRHGGRTETYAPPEGAPAGPVSALAASRDEVWVLAGGGLARIAGGRWQVAEWLPAPDGEPELAAVRALAVRPGDAHAWAATDDGLALVWWDGDAGAAWQRPLPRHPEDDLNNLARCVAPAAEAGGVHVGTAGGLITFAANGSWSLDPSPGDVRALWTGGGTCHLLAWPRGVGRVSAGRVEFLAPQPPGVPLALAVGQDGRPYLLTTRRLYRLDGAEPLPVGDGREYGPCRLAQAADGAWWLGTGRGVFRLAAGRWQLAGENPGPLESEVTGLAVVGGALWVAGTAGLWSREPGGWRRYDWSPDGDSALRALTPAGGAGLWLAGRDGVFRYDPATGAVTTSYRAGDSGLGARRVTGLLEVAGALWVTSRGGVSRRVEEGGTRP